MESTSAIFTMLDNRGSKQEFYKLFPEKVIELGWDYETSWSPAVQSCLFYIIYQHQIIFHN